MAAGQFVEGGIQFARLESFANFYFLATFPPVCAGVVKDILLLRLRLSLWRTFFGFILKL